MTRSQLSRFYSFTGLIYDESPEALAELKKTVLLELKASDKDVLNIGHEQWSKNDLLTCFNTPLDTGFDYASFIADYPWVKNLEHLNIVYYDESIRHTDFSDNRFSQFAEQEGKALEQSFSRLLNQYIAGQNDRYAAALLLYKRCFTSSFQTQLHQQIRQLLIRRFEGVKANQYSNKLIEQTAFFQDDDYYRLVRDAAEDDAELTSLNMKAFKTCFFYCDYPVILRMIKKQLQLNHSASDRKFLEELKQRIERVEQSDQQPSSSRKTFTRIKWIFFVLAGLYVLGKLIVMLDPATRETMFLKKQLETTPFRESIDFNKDSL